MRVVGVLDVSWRRHARQRADAEDARQPQGHGRQGRRRRRQRDQGDRRLSQVPRHRAAGAAALGGDATPRRPRDGQRRQPEPGRERRGVGRARLQGRGQTLPGVPEELSDRPEQRPHPLPDGARLRAERRPRVGAEDARPADQGLPGDALQQRNPVPARRAAVHGEELCRRGEGVRQRARSDRRESVPGPLALHARLVAIQAGPPRGRPEVVLRRARPEGRRPRRRDEPRLDPGPDARRPRAGRGHVPRRQHQPGQPAGRGIDPAVHGFAGAEELRVPRLRPARRALHQAGTSQGRGRHVQPVRAQEPAARAGAGDVGARDPDLREDRLHQSGDRGAQGIHRALRPDERVPARQWRRLGQGAATGQAADHRARAPLSRHRAEDQGRRRLSGSGALVPRAARLVPQRRRRGAEQLPARRAALRGRALCRSRGRVREDRLRLRQARQERRGRLRRAAQLRRAAEEGARCRATGAAALDRRQRAALRADVPGRYARRLGADRHRREALCAEGSRSGRRGRAARRRPQAAGGRRTAARRLDRARLQRLRQEHLCRRRKRRSARRSS